MSSLATDTRAPGFSPFNFQAPLAAGGVTLMAYNWLQSTLSRGSGPLSLSEIPWASLSLASRGLHGALVAIMASLALLNLVLTVVFLVGLARWVYDPEGYRSFMTGPPTRITGAFVPVASLAMTMAVVFASGPFFIGPLAANPGAMTPPALGVFAILFAAALGLEYRLLSDLRARRPDPTQFNFVWLLDVFAFGLTALAGSGLAMMATEKGPAVANALAAAALTAVGSVLLVWKLVVLARNQLASRSLGERQLQPAYFLLAPITCLYAISYYRMLLFAGKWFGASVQLPSNALLTVSYVVAAGWAILVFILLTGYFRDHFRGSEYFPTQWSMV